MTYMLDRLITPRLLKGRKSVLLLGPRQVGKSTLCRSLKPTKTINLADEALYMRYSKDPGRLLRELASISGKGIVVIDEIQRIASLLNSIQAHMDENASHRFILTGSSARKLKRGGANLLPGRIVLEHLDPLSFWELGQQFDLARCLSVGTLPGVYLDEQEGPAVLSTYAQVYLREEIQAEALVKNMGAYARFLDAAAEASGDWINYSKLASDTELPKETIRRFYDILEETLVAFRLPAFSPKKSHRHVTQRDRFLFFDVGVRNALLGIHTQILSPSEKGKLFEQWLILQCLFFARANQKGWKFSSYRTDSGMEVDLIIDIGPKFLAIECKYSRNVTETDLGGLRSFEHLAHKPVQKFVVTLERTPQIFSGKEKSISYQSFLSEILTAL